jgi:hypothetical protein
MTFFDDIVHSLSLINLALFNLSSLQFSGKLFAADPKLLSLSIRESNDSFNRVDSIVETDVIKNKVIMIENHLPQVNLKDLNLEFSNAELWTNDMDAAALKHYHHLDNLEWGNRFSYKTLRKGIS